MRCQSDGGATRYCDVRLSIASSRVKLDANSLHIAAICSAEMRGADTLLHSASLDFVTAGISGGASFCSRFRESPLHRAIAELLQLDEPFAQREVRLTGRPVLQIADRGLPAAAQIGDLRQAQAPGLEVCDE